jgi:hypothetical protein
MTEFLTPAQEAADESAIKIDGDLCEEYQGTALGLTEYLVKLETEMTTLSAAGSINARDYCKVVTRILGQVRLDLIDEDDALDRLCDWSQVLYR